MKNLYFFNLVFARACLQKLFDICVSSHQAFQCWDNSLKKLKMMKNHFPRTFLRVYKSKFLKCNLYKIQLTIAIENIIAATSVLAAGDGAKIFFIVSMKLNRLKNLMILKEDNFFLT